MCAANIRILLKLGAVRNKEISTICFPVYESESHMSIVKALLPCVDLGWGIDDEREQNI